MRCALDGSDIATNSRLPRWNSGSARRACSVLTSISLAGRWSASIAFRSSSGKPKVLRGELGDLALAELLGRRSAAGRSSRPLRSLCLAGPARRAPAGGPSGPSPAPRPESCFCVDAATICDRCSRKRLEANQAAGIPTVTAGAWARGRVQSWEKYAPILIARSWVCTISIGWPAILTRGARLGDVLQVLQEQAVERLGALQREMRAGLRLSSRSGARLRRSRCRRPALEPPARCSGDWVVNSPMISSRMSSSVMRPISSPYSSTTRPRRSASPGSCCSCASSGVPMGTK